MGANNSGAELDFARAQIYVQLYHGQLSSDYERGFRAEPEAVAKVAGRLAHVYYGRPYALAKRPIALARCCGLLVYAMECYGADFDRVMSVVGYDAARTLGQLTPDNRMMSYDTARILSQLSPDMRINGPLRHAHLMSALQIPSDVQAIVQLVRLAECWATVEHLLQRGDAASYTRPEYNLDAWILERKALLKDGLKLLRASRLQRAVTHVHSQLDVLAARLKKAGAMAHAERRMGRPATAHRPPGQLRGRHDAPAVAAHQVSGHAARPG